MNHVIRCSAAVGGLVIVSASQAIAQPLIDNLSESTRAVTKFSVVAPDNIWAAQAFSTPRRLQLDSIDVLVGNAAQLPDAVFQLREGDDPTEPALATFTVPPLAPVGLDVVTLVPDAPVLLFPGRTYWLVTGVASTGTFGWAYAAGNNFTGEGSLLQYRYSEDQGVTWGGAGVDDPYKMRVNVTVVCACPADFDCTGFVDTDDFTAFVLAFEAGTDDADFDVSGFVDTDDFTAFVLAFEAGC